MIFPCQRGASFKTNWEPLTYNNVVSQYFSKMLFAGNPGKFSAFAFLSLFKKSYRNIEENGLQSNDDTENGTFFSSIDGINNGTKKVPLYSTAV